MTRCTYVKVPTGWLALDGSGTIVPFGVPVPPPPVPGKRIGVYMSGNNTGLNAYTAGWPKQPNAGSFYCSWNTTVAGTPLMSTYASQGRWLHVELATRISGSNYVTWADIASGTYDAHLISFITALDALGTTVYLSLDNEADIKATSGTGEVAPGQTAAQYVAAANHLFDLIHAHSTNVKAMVWLAGGTPNTAKNFLPAHSKLDAVGWDPYKTGTHKADTATSLFAAFINAVLVPAGYADIPRHINESGIVVGALATGGSYSTQDQIDFYNGWPAAMDANQIVCAVWFRANSGAHPYIPTDPSVDAAFEAMVAANT